MLPRVIGSFFVVIGVLGLLATPTLVMFSEGLAESDRSNPGLFLVRGIVASVAFVVIGIGLRRHREWARLLGMALLVVWGIAVNSVVSLLIGAGLALLLAIRWPAPAQP